MSLLPEREGKSERDRERERERERATAERRRLIKKPPSYDTPNACVHKLGS